jgi:hypothetical protein
MPNIPYTKEFLLQETDTEIVDYSTLNFAGG